MIDLYSCPTPNCQKVSIALEELGLPYRVHPIDIVAGDQNEPAFAAICANRKVPATVDSDGPGGVPLTLWESGAILLYLAEKAGALLPRDAVRRAHCMQWLFWQMSYVGPMMGQFAPLLALRAGAARVSDRALSQRGGAAEALAGPHARGAKVSRRRILDRRHCLRAVGEDVRAGYPNEAPYPHMDAWVERVFARPEVQRGIRVDLDKLRPVVVGAVPVTDDVRKHLFASYQDGDGSTCG